MLLWDTTEINQYPRGDGTYKCDSLKPFDQSDLSQDSMTKKLEEINITRETFGNFEKVVVVADIWYVIQP